MRFTIGLPTDRVDAADELVSGDGVAEVASGLEDAGFDACFVTDHPAPDARWLAAGGHHALDPFVALSFAAAATRRLLLQTHILVLPYRNPLLAAKSVLSLDVLSGGRVVLGVATGYLKPEFAALGVDFEERNALTDEAIDVMRRAWTDDDVAYEGRHFRSRGTTMRPRSPQIPHPPIWVGGNSTAAIRRAVERGQGWVPFPNPVGAARSVRTAQIGSLDDLAPRLDLMREHARAVGRTAPLDVCFGPFALGQWNRASEPLDARAVVAEVRRLADLGVTWCVLGVPADATTRAAYLDAARTLADSVIDPVRG